MGSPGTPPERLKRQQQWAHVFDIKTKKAEGGPVDGEQWGLPWPCWHDKHPGTHILYRLDTPASRGGAGVRAGWGPKAAGGETTLSSHRAAPGRGPHGPPPPPQ